MNSENISPYLQYFDDSVINFQIVAEFERILGVTSSVKDQFKVNFTQMSNKNINACKNVKKGQML